MLFQNDYKNIKKECAVIPYQCHFTMLDLIGNVI